MCLSNTNLNETFEKRKVLKVITGLDNFDVNEIVEITKAAQIGGATYLDVAANKEIIREVKKYTDLPICVSSIEAKELYDIASEEIDLLEIGNYDTLYSKGIVFSQHEILNLVQEVMSFWSSKDICVTIPYNLSLNEQIKLSLKLEKMGVKILQTEGIYTKNNLSFSDNSNISSSIRSASSSLSSTYAISQFVKIPVLSSSGIGLFSAKLAIFYGAAGVGLCTAIKNCKNFYQKSYYIKQIVDTIYGMKSYIAEKTLSSIQTNYESIHFV